MALRPFPKKDPRPKALTIRVSEKTFRQLSELADYNNMSQADVVEQLLEDEYLRHSKRRGKTMKAAENDG